MKSFKAFITNTPGFISTRTHFKFVRRSINYLAKILPALSRSIGHVFLKVPVLGLLMRIVDNTLDTLAFGTNTQLSDEARSIALFGYGFVIVSAILAYATGAAALTSLLAPCTILLGLYFEAETFWLWLGNLDARNSMDATDPNKDQLVLEARIMVSAASLTFIGMSFSALALVLAASNPAISLGFLVVGLGAEIGGALGSLGKEYVNISLNKREVEEYIEHTFETEPKSSLSRVLSHLGYEHSKTKVTPVKQHDALDVLVEGDEFHIAYASAPGRLQTHKASQPSATTTHPQHESPALYPLASTF